MKASVDLFDQMFHTIAPWLMTCSILGKAAVHWVGLSAPVVALSCASTIYLQWLVCPCCRRFRCVHPAGAPYRGEAPARQGATDNVSPFSLIGRKREAARPKWTLTHTTAPPFFFRSSILTSSRTSYPDRLTTHLLNVRSNQGLLSFTQ